MFPTHDLHSFFKRVDSCIGLPKTVQVEHPAEMRTFEGLTPREVSVADRLSKAPEALPALTDAIKLRRDPRRSFGFNEWILPQGQFQRDKTGRPGLPRCNSIQRNAFDLEKRHILIVSFWHSPYSLTTGIV